MHGPLSPPPFVSNAELKSSDWRRRSEYQRLSWRDGGRERRRAGFISGCMLSERHTSSFGFNICKTKSEEEKCKESNWDLENFEDGKQSFNLSIN